MQPSIPPQYQRDLHMLNITKYTFVFSTQLKKPSKKILDGFIFTKRKIL